MTTKGDPKATTNSVSQAVRQTSHQASRQASRQMSRQQTPSQSYFSASPSPPPSTPPPPPPVTQINIVPFPSRVAASATNRNGYAKLGSEQCEQQILARSKGRPVPEIDASILDMNGFNQQSSNETPVERFCYWDPVEDSNVVHARTAMAEIQRKQDEHDNADAENES